MSPWLFCAILLLFIRSENGGRLGWYFVIGLISTLTVVLSASLKDVLNKLIVYAVVVFLYFRIVLAWGVLLSPYKTFLYELGYVKETLSMINMSNNPNYADDKFHR